jgi:SanA protein
MAGLVRRHRLLAVACGLAVAGSAAVLALNAYVLVRGSGATSDVADVGHAQVAIVPGALVHADGRMSAMLADRVAGAAALYEAGKVDRVLVSGDHGRLGYNETDTMRDAVIAAGVPAARVFTDYAGFDTWSTVRRAREIFGVSDAVLVTQPFHMPRALYLGRAAGLEVQGLETTRDYGNKGALGAARELLARVKGAGQGIVRPAVLGGPELPIGGDGRSSWGPEDPLAP